MQLAIFGITNDGLNLAVNLILLILVVVWIALIVYTFLDARRRIEDPVLVACATIASFVPYVGTAVYAILRPPEYLDDARERELEIQAAELRVRELSERACPNCGYTVEKNFLRCPNCQRRLKDPCGSCGKPVDPRWALCPYCETPTPGRARGGRREPPPPGEKGERRDRGRGARSERAERAEPGDRRANRPPPSGSEGRGNSSPASREDSVPPPPPPPRRRASAPGDGSDEDGGSGGSRRRPDPPRRANR
jgi:RNA polymerase subunit RPABC4/transcription elongation factor Spt4